MTTFFSHSQLFVFKALTDRILELKTVLKNTKMIKIKNDSTTIQLKNTTIIAPKSDIIVENVNFILQPGEKVLIIGANGIGKTSIFRVLKGLWNVKEGEVYSPEGAYFLYVFLMTEKYYISELSFFKATKFLFMSKFK